MNTSWITSIPANGFALIVLFILLVDSVKKRSRFLLPDQVIFLLMLSQNILILLLDSAAWLLDGLTFARAHLLNTVVTTLYFASNPVMSLLYLCYCDIKLGVSSARLRRFLPLYCLPVLVNLVLTVASIRYGLLFRLDAANVYHRGSVFFLSFVLSYFLLAVALVKILKVVFTTTKQDGEGRRKPRKSIVSSLLFFPIPPLLGGCIQAWSDQVTVIWVSTVFSLLISFINIQNSEISTDVLTGLYNRRQAENYLHRLLQMSAKDVGVAFIIMDINNFKQINDHFGHLQGDNALRAAAQVLQGRCGKDDFVCRYGGDEFVIIAKHGDEKKSADLVAQINRDMGDYCASRNLDYTLSVSAGYAVWPGNFASSDALISAVDAMLYRNKARLLRRSGDRE